VAPILALGLGESYIDGSPGRPARPAFDYNYGQEEDAEWVIANHVDHEPRRFKETKPRSSPLLHSIGEEEWNGALPTAIILNQQALCAHKTKSEGINLSTVGGTA
jgi:hypothetical protein